MCFKCDTNLTQEQWDRQVRKFITNAMYGLEPFQRVIAYHDKQIQKILPNWMLGRGTHSETTRLQPLHDMVKNVKKPLLERVYRIIIRKTLCHGGHYWDGKAIYRCLRCDTFGGLDRVVLNDMATELGISIEGTSAVIDWFDPETWQDALGLMRLVDS